MNGKQHYNRPTQTAFHRLGNSASNARLMLLMHVNGILSLLENQEGVRTTGHLNGPEDYMEERSAVGLLDSHSRTALSPLTT